MKILVLNAGSSSLKYSLFEMSNSGVLISGLLEKIGENNAIHHYTLADAEPQQTVLNLANHQQALQALFQLLTATGLLADQSELRCVGHRVVHGGEHFTQPTLITPTVLQQLQATVALAPLHNPANLLGINIAMQEISAVPHIAVFDTAFHQTMPDYAYRYALPAELYSQHGVRRYGFHGTSHRYVAKLAAQYLNKPLTQTNLITLHLGNGASVAAIENGCSVDTSMGMTPLAGLMMGTRCGDIDPAIVFYLSSTLDISNAEIENLLNKASGCKGVCGENDMRRIHALAESGLVEAKLALAMYAYRVKKYIGAYFAVLNRVDALVFTGGIGEHDHWLRAACCQNLSIFGISLDDAKNLYPNKPVADISTTDSKLALLVINTNEELEIAMQAQACVAELRAAVNNY